MSHQLPAALMAACLVIPTITACDGHDVESPDLDGLVLASPDGAEPGDVTFREPGPPKALYVTEWQGKAIDRLVAKQIIDGCANLVNPPQTCTLSWYQPDTAQPTFVMGLGCSMMATLPLIDCYRARFLQNDAQEI